MVTMYPLDMWPENCFTGKLNLLGTCINQLRKC